MIETATSSISPHAPLPISWIESLFKRMSWAYGSKFADLWNGVNPVEMKNYWAERLGALSRAELATGYRMLDSRDRPPTLPEFIKLCRPNLDPVMAFHEALEQGSKRDLGKAGEPDVWSHPAIYWAWVKIGSFAMMHQGYEVLRPRWVAALSECTEDPDLPPVPVKMAALPAPGKTQMPPERARELLAQLRIKRVPLSVVGQQTDWARQVLAKHERGEPVTFAALKMAEQALGL
jgi:hypothetical protein